MEPEGTPPGPDTPASDASAPVDGGPAPSIPAWARRLCAVLERVATRSPQFFGPCRMVQARLKAEDGGRVVVAIGLTNGRERLVVEVRGRG